MTSYPYSHYLQPPKSGIFCYDLEISESLENATPNATIRLQNVPLKKYAFIFNICPDFYKSQQPVQKSSVV